jgi:hypothetical protein
VRREPKSTPVGCIPATKLVNELVEAADEKQLSKTIARYGRIDAMGRCEIGIRAGWPL